MLERYGVEHGMQNKEIYDKARASMEVLKPYMLGRRTVLVQGYEPKALDWLLVNGGYSPSEIQCGAKNKKVPVVYYTHKGVTKAYHPDIYIPHENLIIEVKSDYTYCSAFEINEAKRRACQKQGYRFKYLVMSARGERIGTRKLKADMRRRKDSSSIESGRQKKRRRETRIRS